MVEGVVKITKVLAFYCGFSQPAQRLLLSKNPFPIVVKPVFFENLHSAADYRPRLPEFFTSSVLKFLIGEVNQIIEYRFACYYYLLK